MTQDRRNIEAMIGTTVWTVLFLAITIQNGVETTKIEVTVHRNVPAKLLSCWTCSHGNRFANVDCVRMTNTSAIEQRECHLHEYFCKVKRITDERGVQLMERACATKCSTGCQQINKLQSCEDCCSQPLCNVGNMAADKLFTVSSVMSCWIPCVFVIYKAVSAT